MRLPSYAFIGIGAVAVAFVCAVPYGATAGEEFSTEAFLPPADGKDAYTPAVAFGKDAFLVAWRSGHLAPGDLREGLKFDAKIVACRVDRDGRLMDAAPFVVSAAADLRERPMAAFGGGVFLLVWQDLRNGKDWDVYAARVAPDGKTLDPDGIPVGAGPHNQALPDVAWDGRNFQVVWQDFRSGSQYQVYGARVSPEGKVLDVGGVALAESQISGGWGKDQLFNPSVAAVPGSGRSLLFWLAVSLNVKDKPLAACRFVENGRPAGAFTFTISEARKGPGGQHSTFPTSLAAGGKTCLLVWTTNAPWARGAPPNDANAMVLDADGRPVKSLALSGVLGPPWNCPVRIRNPRAAWDGASFVAAWDEWDQNPVGRRGNSKRLVEAVFAARVTETGEAGPKVRLSGEFDSPAIKPAVASDGAGTTLVAYEKHPAAGDVPIKIGFRMLPGRK
ncbi:MAG: hypothetical protein N3A38_13120 [Planctomycetota bacterium]|nr:hypothetical protein [Planctomycetota bacterium]